MVRSPSPTSRLLLPSSNCHSRLSSPPHQSLFPPFSSLPTGSSLCHPSPHSQLGRRSCDSSLAVIVTATATATNALSPPLLPPFFPLPLPLSHSLSPLEKPHPMASHPLSLFSLARRSLSHTASPSILPVGSLSSEQSQASPPPTEPHSSLAVDPSPPLSSPSSPPTIVQASLLRWRDPLLMRAAPPIFKLPLEVARRLLPTLTTG